MDADITQIVKLAGDFERATTKVAVLSSQIVRKSSADLVGQGKARAAVDTGFYRESIGTDPVQIRGALVFADSGPTADYGAHLEFGTMRMAPHPAMLPAADVITPNFEAAAERIVDL